jgi:chromosome segregation ATPase
MGKKKKRSPAPPPAKTYTQAEVDKLKSDWKTKSQSDYDTRLAGQKDLWGAQEAQRKAEYILEQSNLYADKLATAKGDWQTAADARYDTRLGEARTAWHDLAEKQYDDRLSTAQGTWQSEADLKAQEAQAAFNKKYGALQGQYDTAQRDYQDLQGQYGQTQEDYQAAQDRYKNLTGKYDHLQGQYDTRGQEYSDLQDRYGKLEGDYESRGSDYDTLENRYSQAEKDLNRYQTDERREDYGGGGRGDWGERETNYYDDGPSSNRGSSGLSSDQERHALLTGDYSFLTTDKGKERGQKGSDSWKKYLR